MKKLTKFAFSLVLALALILALAVCAYADASVSKEYVAYGYGMPEAAPVDMHGLSPDSITLDGIALSVRCEDGKMFLRLTDLASAKLLRDSADKAKELGLDYSKLYISDGIILVREDGLTADEIADIQAKLSELTRNAEIKVSEGETFAFSNGGETVLIVELGGFIMPPAPEKQSEAAADNVKLDVKSARVNAEKEMEIISSGDFAPSDISVPERSSVSTVYISYVGGSGYNITGSEGNDYTNAKITASAVNVYRDGFAFLVKAEDDTNDYFICVSYGEDSPSSFTKMKDAGALEEGETMTEDKEAFSIVDPPAASPAVASETDGVDEQNPEEKSSEYKLAKTITIATDSAGQNVVKTINLKEGIKESNTFADINIIDEEKNVYTGIVNGEKEYGNSESARNLYSPEGENVSIEVSESTEGAPAADSSVETAPEVDATVWDDIEAV